MEASAHTPNTTVNNISAPHMMVIREYKPRIVNIY
jgi:hypothetical protein